MTKQKAANNFNKRVFSLTLAIASIFNGYKKKGNKENIEYMCPHIILIIQIMNQTLFIS